MKEPHTDESKRQAATGWFRASRYPQMPDLVKSSRTAFVVAYSLAFRARWNDAAFNPYKLAIGEALCDYHNWGLSEQEFRSGRDKLKEWGFATFRATNRGTVGKLVDTRLFSVLLSECNERTNGQGNGPTTNQPTGQQRAGQRHTKSKEQKSKEQKSKKGSRDTPDAPQAPHRVNKGRLATRRGVPGQVPSAAEVLAHADSKYPDHDGKAVDRFNSDRERDGWRPNGKPIRTTWKNFFDGFYAKYETDRKGNR